MIYRADARRDTKKDICTDVLFECGANDEGSDQTTRKPRIVFLFQLSCVIITMKKHRKARALTMDEAVWKQLVDKAWER